MAPIIKLFYQNYDDDEGIASENPVAVTKEQAVDYMENLPPGENNFVGFVLPSGQVVQFMYTDDDGNILLDIPVANGAYSKSLDSFEETIEVIEYLFEGKDPMLIEGLSFDTF